MESSIWSCFLPLLILLLNSPVDSVSFFESSRLNNFSLNPESYFFLLVIPPRLFKLALLDEQACVKKSSCFLRYAFYLYNDSFILFSISILYCWLWSIMRSWFWEIWEAWEIDLVELHLRMGSLSMLEWPTFISRGLNSTLKLLIDEALCISNLFYLIQIYR